MSADDFRGPVGNASAKYESGNPVTRALLRRFLAEIDRTVAALQPSSVLDVGCGEGVVTERLAADHPDAAVVGLDADDPGLRSEWDARGRANLSFRTGSAYDLAFDDGAFELVCALEVLEHLERPRDALAEMARVSARAVLVSVPREPVWRVLHVLAGRDLRRLGNTDGHINHWSAQRFRSLVSEFGRVIELRTPLPWTVVALDVRESRQDPRGARRVST